MTYVITYRNYLQGLAVRTAASKEAAEAFVVSHEKGDPAAGSILLSEPLDFSGRSKPFLVDLYNALGKEGDAKVAPTAFASRAIGVERIFARLTQYYGNSPAVVAGETAPSSDEAQPPATAHEESTDMATKAKVVKKKVKKAKVAGDKKPRDRKPTGKGKPIRRASSLGKILELAIEGASTKEQIAKATKLRPDQVMHRIGQVMRINNGIEHSVTKDGVIKVSLPDGFNKNSIFKEKAE